MMKKTNKLFLTMCVAGSFALLFGSCKKNEEVKEIAINLPAFQEEVDTRAYIDYGNSCHFMWNNNDEVAIYNLDQAGVASEKAIFATTDDAEGRAQAVFTNTGENLSAKMYGYFAFYPVAKVEADLQEGNYQTFTVPATQTYTVDPAGTPTVDPAGMALACELSSLEEGFTLKHIFGALRLKLTGAGNVNKIEVEDARYNLAGNATMKLHEVNMTTFTELQTAFIGTEDPDNDVNFYGAWNEYKETLDWSAEGAGKVMTLNCTESVALSEDGAYFVIGLRPGALKYGFTVRVYLDGENAPRVFDYTGNNNLHYGIKAGMTKNLTLNVQ